jgi:hypothetical protein
LIITAALTALTPLLLAVLRNIPAFTENIYLPFSRVVSAWLGVLFSFTSYTAAEFILVLLTGAAIYCLVCSVKRSHKGKTLWPMALWGSGLIMYAAGSVFLFVLLWGGTYSASKLDVRLGLGTEPQTETILYKTAKKHLSDVLMYSDIPRDSGGAADAGGFKALAPEAAAAMRALMKSGPDIYGSVPVSPPKRALSYAVLGAFGISGIYIPFTGEAIVNTISTDPFLPSVMTHELAHRLGFAQEDDANFIAYLACMESEEQVFRYSGALMAFNYCYNALSDPELRRSLWSTLEKNRMVLQDFARNREAWQKYDRPVLRESAAAVNNSYLRSMGQADGVKSYGKVVDLLIALYLSELEDNN